VQWDQLSNEEAKIIVGEKQGTHLPSLKLCPKWLIEATPILAASKAS
jgi:hypothetical protein